MTHDETAIAVDKARYIGDIVAAVAAARRADSRAGALPDPLRCGAAPEYSDPHSGLTKVAEPIHARGLNGTNIQKEVVQHFGDVDAAFAHAAHTARVRGTFAGVTHAFTEPLVTLAEASPDGRLTVWSATQVPHYLHRSLSEVLGIPMHRIRVIKPEVGGGFGGKSDPLPHEIVCAALSLETGRPVRMLLDREDVFYTNHGRHPTQNDVRVAVDAEGHITAYDIDAVIDGGAWSSFGTVTTYYNGVLAMGPYRVPNFRYRGRRVYTTKPPSGAMRAHGGTNIRYSIEVALDRIAEKTGIDPFDLRRRNAIPPNSRTVNEFRITSTSFLKCLAAARERSGWDSKFRKLPFGRGVGLGCGFYISGSNSPIHFTPKIPQSTVHLKVDMDGGIAVHSMQADIGQGSNTLLAVIVAEVLGVDLDAGPRPAGRFGRQPDRPRVILEPGHVHDGQRRPGRGRGAPRQGRRGRRRAARSVGGGTRGGARADPAPRGAGRGRAVPGGIAQGHGVDRALTATGSYRSSAIGGSFKGARAGTAPAYSFSAYVAEVEVDVETGVFAVEKVWAAFDCGRALNRLAVEGQIEGRSTWGLAR